MSAMLDTVIKAPIDAIGRKIVTKINSPMGIISAGTTGAFTGILVANAVSDDGFLSKNGVLTIGLNAVSGAAMLGIGAAYHKPYFTTMGQVTLGATAVGMALGSVGMCANLIPKIHMDVQFGDK